MESSFSVLFICDNCIESLPLLERFQIAGVKVDIAHSVQDVGRLSTESVAAVVVTTDEHLRVCRQILAERVHRTAIVRLYTSSEIAIEHPVTTAGSWQATSTEEAVTAVLTRLAGNAPMRLACVS